MFFAGVENSRVVVVVVVAIAVDRCLKAKCSNGTAISKALAANEPSLSIKFSSSIFSPKQTPTKSNMSLERAVRAKVRPIVVLHIPISA